MNYKKLGTTGVKISELCLGTMTFGRETDEEMSAKIISRFLDIGGNFIDTADVYGTPHGMSEEIVGRAIKGKRDNIILATKCGFTYNQGQNNEGFSRTYLLKVVKESLRRLQTDYIDLYYLHRWDEVTPLEEALETLDTLIKSGKIRYIGVSNFAAWQLMKALGISNCFKWQRFVSIQLQYNLLVRDIERELIPLCIEEKVGIITWAPLAGGFLSGKYYQNKALCKNGRLLRMKKGHTDSWERRVTEKNLKILSVIKKIAKARGNTCSQIALAWICAQPGITAPIIGARTIEQLNDNLGCINCKLNQEELNTLNKVSEIEKGYPYEFINNLSRR